MGRPLCACLLAGALVAGRAEAQGVDQYLGRTLVDVRIDVAGRPLTDPAVGAIMETRVGEPLAMPQVRATIDHLVGLGRFQDIRAVASPAELGVALLWMLTPVRLIENVSVSGRAVLSESDLRAELVDRFGQTPSAARSPDIVRALEAFYADRGYRHVAITPTVADLPTPGRVDLRLAIVAGPRTTIGSTTVSGAPREPAAELIHRLGFDAGRPFDLPTMSARIAKYEEELHGLGYYEGRVRESHTFSEDGLTAGVTIDVVPGPHVTVVFAGDPLPESERQALVPIRDERSVDLDLLEDASRNIEAALRRQGYRGAQAPYARQQTGGELLLTFTVARGPQHRVGAVDVSGASGIDRLDLMPFLQLKPDEPFVDARVSAVAAAITELYHVRGFAQAVVTPAVQILPPDTRGSASFRPVDIRFQIAEGPKTTVSAVDIRGASAVGPEALRGLVGLDAGKPFYRPQLTVDRDSLEREYRNRGYQTASVAPQVAFEDEGRGVTVVWMIREGPQIAVDHILITGNTRTNIGIIRRELTLSPGSPLSDAAMAESQRKLAALGLFRRVRISELPRSGDTSRDVLIEIEEAEATTISYGGGLEVGRILRSSDTGGPAEEQLDFAPRAFFDISRRNLWGKNRSVTLFARLTLRRREPAADNPDPTDTGGYGLNDYRGLFSFREPRAFGTTGDAQVSAFIEQGTRSSFNFNRKGVSTDYARRFGTISVTGRYTFDYTKLFDEQIAPEDQLLIDRLFPQVKLSKIFGAVLRDSRDDVLNPQQGAVVGIDGSVAARILGSEVGFVKTFVQGFLYRRLPGRRVVVAMGARLGTAVGVADAAPGGSDPAQTDTVVRDLPASERFFSGGDTTVRGFALDRLGTAETLDPQGFPQGGNGLVVFNLETRAPYWKNIQFVWFSDVGNVFRYAGDIRLNDLRVTTGVGFRYRSPIGPLRVDWGFKVSTRLLLTGGREGSNVLHISLGQAF